MVICASWYSCLIPTFVKHELRGVMKCLGENNELPLHTSIDITDTILANHHRREKHMKNSWRKGALDITKKHHIRHGFTDITDITL